MMRWLDRAAKAALFLSIIFLCPADGTLPAWAGTGYEIEYGATTNPDGTVTLHVEYFSAEQENIHLHLPVTWEGEKVTGIAPEAFWIGMDAIGEVTIPEGVTEIGERAFYGCSGLRVVHLPGTLTRIGEEAFGQCTALEQIDLAADNEAFQSQNGVLISQERTLLWYPPGRRAAAYAVPEGTARIASGAFSGNGYLKRITLPKSLTQVDAGALSCPSLEEIVVTEGNKSYQAPDGVLYTKNLQTLCAYPAARDRRVYAAKEELRVLASYAFAGAASLERVLLPKELGYIGPAAFQGCGALRSFAVPEGVTEIGGGAFAGCAQLEEIRLPQHLGRIAEECFLEDACLKEISIPEGVGYICYGAFLGCSALEEVRIPQSVQYVDPEAFEADCGAMFHVVRGSAGARYARLQHFALEQEEPPKENRVYTDAESIKKAQQALNALGFEAGREDGLMGARTRSAIRSYREAKHLPASDEVDDELLDSLAKELAGKQD